MSEFLDKLSSYNVFNYLFPGAIFAAIVTYATPYDLVHNDILVGIFVYYFLGLVISRVGSLILEPALQKFSFVKFAPYSDFVTACEKDKQVSVLSETNNMYRTLISLFILVALAKLYAYLESSIPIVSKYGQTMIVVILIVLFLFSYRKQTQYVVKRINVVNEK